MFFRQDSLVVVDFIPGGSKPFFEPFELGVDWFEFGMVSMDTLPDGRLIQNWTHGRKLEGVKSLH